MLVSNSLPNDFYVLVYRDKVNPNWGKAANDIKSLFHTAKALPARSGDHGATDKWEQCAKAKHSKWISHWPIRRKNISHEPASPKADEPKCCDVSNGSRQLDQCDASGPRD